MPRRTRPSLSRGRARSRSSLRGLPLRGLSGRRRRVASRHAIFTSAPFGAGGHLDRGARRDAAAGGRGAASLRGGFQAVGAALASRVQRGRAPEERRRAAGHRGRGEENVGGDNPLFPARRSGPPAVSGAARKKQIPAPLKATASEKHQGNIQSKSLSCCECRRKAEIPGMAIRASFAP